MSVVVPKTLINEFEMLVKNLNGAFTDWMRFTEQMNNDLIWTKPNKAIQTEIKMCIDEIIK